MLIGVKVNVVLAITLLLFKVVKGDMEPLPKAAKSPIVVLILVQENVVLTTLLVGTI